MIFDNFSQRPPEAYFHGYAWSGIDLYLSPQPYTGSDDCIAIPVKAGLDGCYVVCSKTQTGWVIGTDASGLSKLFVYKEGDDWAVGDSFSELVTHLKNSQRYITPVKEILEAIRAPRNFTDCLFSFQTPIREIQLIHQHEQVSVSNEGTLSIHAMASRRVTQLSTNRALEHYLSLWRSRMLTALEGASQAQIDLTGGMDSRIVFAQLASSSGISKYGHKLHFYSNPAQTRDYEIAARIIANFRLELDPTVPSPWPVNSPSEAIESWKRRCLGVYLPVYLPQSILSTKRIHFHGAGGETLRISDHPRSFRSVLAHLEPHISPHTKDAIKDLLLADAEKLAELDYGASETLRHYRAFRNRFHFGHMPQSELVISPLMSFHARELVDRRTNARDKDFFYSVLKALPGQLLKLPFEDADKNPRLIDRLRPRPQLRVTEDHGKVTVFKSAPAPEHQAGHHARRDSLHQEWKNHSMQVLTSDITTAFLPSEELDRARLEIQGRQTMAKPNEATSKLVSYASILELIYGD